MGKELRYSLIMMGGVACAAALGMLFSIIVGRVLGPELSADFFGGISLCLVLFSFIGPINSTVAKFTSVYYARGEIGKVEYLRKVVIRISFYIAGIFVVVGVIVSPFVQQWLHFQSITILYLLLAMVVIAFPMYIYRGVLRGLHAFSDFVLSIIIESGLRLCIGLLLLTMFVRPESAFCAYIAASVCGVSYAYVRMKKRLGDCVETDTVDWNAIRTFFVCIAINAVVAAGYQQLDMLCVKRFFAPHIVGEYGAALTLVRVVHIVFYALNGLAIPLFAAQYASGKPVLRSLLRIMGYYLLCVGVFIAIVCGIKGSVVQLCFGADYAAATAFIVPLASAHSIAYAGFLVTSVCAASDRFSYLWILAGSVLLLAAGFHWFHASVLEVVYVLGVVSVIMLLGLLVCVWTQFKGGGCVRHGKDRV